MMDLSIIPECFVDTNLIETIVPPQGKGYNHQKGCGTVTKVMKENFNDRFAVGIIDKDKKQIDYLKEFLEIVKKDSLLLYKHKNKHHYIIQIVPAMEKFIISNAHSVDISILDYNISNELDSLKKESKQQQSKKDERFKKLFRDLKKSGAADIITLSNWIKYLRDNNYNVDIEYLKTI
jgi:hypothetical protein